MGLQGELGALRCFCAGMEQGFEVEGDKYNFLERGKYNF